VHPIEWLRAVARSSDVPQTRLAAEAAGALAAIADEPHGLLPACRRLIDRNPAAGALWWTCARLLSSADPGREARAVQTDLESDQVGLSLALDLPDEAAVVVLGWSDIAGEMTARRGDVRLMVVAEETPPARSTGRRGTWAYDDDAIDDDDEDGTVVIVPPLGVGAAVTSADLLLVDAWAVGDNEVIAAPGTLAAVAVAARMHTPVWFTVSVGRRLPEALFKALTDRVYRPGVEPWDAPVDLLDLKDTALTVVEPLVIPCPVPPELLRRTT